MSVIRIIILVIIFAVIIFSPAVCAENASVITNKTPFVTIDVTGNHTRGETFIIRGTTNLPVSQEKSLVFSIGSLGFSPGGNRGGFFFATNPTILAGINETNFWSVDVTDLGIPEPEKYLVSVESTDLNISIYQYFNAIDPLLPQPPEKAFITIDPIGNHTVGYAFVIHGTTNLPVSEKKSLLISIVPTWKDSDQYSGFRYDTYLKIYPGGGKTNQWSAYLAGIDWRPNDEYFVKVTSLSVHTQGSSPIEDPFVSEVFTMLPENSSTPENFTIISPSPQTTIQSLPTDTTYAASTPLPQSTTPHLAPFPWLLSITAIFAVIWILKSCNETN